MSDPTRGSSGARHRANADRRLGKPTAEDSLMVEAYGTRGAAMRKTAGKMGEGLAKADSTLRQKTVARVKKLFGG